jgi:hypothetical protein
MLILLGLWIGAGCQSEVVEAHAPVAPPNTETVNPPSTSGPVPPGQGDAVMTPSPSIPPETGLQHLIDKAVADLAQRLSIPATQITLIEATPVVWSDASLGCPQPGMAYAQVPEDGLRIRLQAGGQVYEYHSGGARDPFLCVQTVKESSPPPQIDFFNLTPSEPTSPSDTGPTPDNSIPPGENE